MNKSKLFFGLAFLGTLVACGPQQENLPPEIRSGSVGTISPYDTVSLSFTEAVPTITAAQVSSEPAVSLKKKGSSYVLVGDSIVAGLAMFKQNTAYEVHLSDLESESGEVQDQDQLVVFRTMRILDVDFSKDSLGNYLDNNTRAKADLLADSAEFFDGTAIETGLTIAGLLAGTAHAVADDDQDWYSIQLRVEDSIQIELKGMTQNLNLEFRGPINSSGVIYDEVNASTRSGTSAESIQLSIGSDRAYHGIRGTSSSMESPQTYFIGVKHGATGDTKPASPYVLTVKKIPIQD